MKKCLYALAMLFIATSLYSQENTLPTNGNVGIGTLTPSEKLDVNGKAIFDSLVVMKDSLEIEKSLRVKDKFKVDDRAVFKENVVVQGDLKVQNKAVFNGLLKSTTPDVKFQNLNKSNSNQFARSNFAIIDSVSGKVRTVTTGFVSEQIYSPFLCPQTVDGITIPPVWSNIPNVLYTASSVCHNDARVGIGTNNPNARLGINLNSISIDNALLINSFRSVTGSYEMFKLTRQGEMELTIHTDDTQTPFLIKDQNGKKLFKIDATGYARARRVRVDTEVWPDYVFEDDYELKSLEETEKFIEDNGHLPDVPSAEEVEQEGQDLGEMNKILMQKVEELTLHLIEQNKRINSLEEQLKKQESNKTK